MTAPDPKQPVANLESMRQSRLTFFVFAPLILGGCSIDTDARREHWSTEAQDFFSEQRQIDDLRNWLETVSSDAQLIRIGTVENTIAGTYVATLEDLGDDWVCRYRVVLDASVDAASVVTSHKVVVQSACL